MSSRKPRPVGNMHIFVACKIDVVNKQLVSTFSWNKPLSEPSLGESYILTISCIYLLYVYTQFFNSILKGTLMPLSKILYIWHERSSPFMKYLFMGY